MKAIVQETYGGPEVLEPREIDRPATGEDEVLLRVRAAALNPLDHHDMRGLPYFLRIGNGLRRPKHPVRGVDVAGQVEAVGKNVSLLSAGDEVFGLCKGTCAEYTKGTPDRLVPKPAGLTFEQAAALPVAALSALQALRNRGQLEPQQRVLIVGASGGVGTCAVQIAKAFGAEVTGVCSGGNVELVRSLGADRVIDYTQDDFTRGESRYDLIVDMAGTHSLSACRRAMTRRGRYVVVGAPVGRWIKGPDRFLKAMLLSPFVGQQLLPFVAQPNRDDLAALIELVEAGKLKPVIDRIYPLSETAEAMRHLETKRARGKVVVTV